MDAIKTGNYIRAKREEKGFTQEQLAELVNATPRSIQNWESGTVSNIRSDKLERLADALDVSIHEIRSGQDLNVSNDIKNVLDDLTRQVIQAEEKALLGIQIGIFGLALGYLAFGFAGSAKYPNSIIATIFLLLFIILSLALLFFGSRYIKRNEQDLKARKASTSERGNSNARSSQQ